MILGHNPNTRAVIVVVGLFIKCNATDSLFLSGYVVCVVVDSGKKFLYEEHRPVRSLLN